MTSCPLLPTQLPEEHKLIEWGLSTPDLSFFLGN